MARPRKSSEELKAAGAKPGRVRQRIAEEAAELAGKADPNAPPPGLSLLSFIAQVKRERESFFERLVPEPSNPLTKPAINDFGEPVQSLFKFGSSITIFARRMWESIRTACRMTHPPSRVEDLDTTDTVSIQVSPTVKNTFWSAQSQDDLAQTAFRFAIFCAMNITTPRSPSSMRPNNRQNLTSVRWSLPELPHRMSSADLRFNRFGNLGGSSPS